MGLLDSFDVVPFVTGVSSMSVTKDGVSFNKTAIEKLGSPEYVQVLIDKANHRLAIVPCETGDEGARPFLRKGRTARAGVRWNNTDLKESIQGLTKWDLEQAGHKITGQFFPDDHAMVFDLDDSAEIGRRDEPAD
ncbi:MULTISPECIES: hypothetical protein [Bifidobacterium]|uniref:Uncharacterized protein n=1 Tax=Bifidobacterium reuteri DSM 23975 TaxID=1437610 RepID=A0A087CTX2_9BIFI|nr:MULTISPECIES: hypothetical protein [Bifidobacterium]KFI86722.1 hypothetical protein BREU_1793 [Bifidobacterium reuteri DSM 23975]